MEVITYNGRYCLLLKREQDQCLLEYLVKKNSSSFWVEKEDPKLVIQKISE